jgi:hypothetical protein
VPERRNDQSNIGKNKLVATCGLDTESKEITFAEKSSFITKISFSSNNLSASSIIHHNVRFDGYSISEIISTEHVYGFALEIKAPKIIEAIQAQAPDDVLAINEKLDFYILEIYPAKQLAESKVSPDKRNLRGSIEFGAKAAGTTNCSPKKGENEDQFLFSNRISVLCGDLTQIATIDGSNSYRLDIGIFNKDDSWSLTQIEANNYPISRLVYVRAGGLSIIPELDIYKEIVGRDNAAADNIDDIEVKNIHVPDSAFINN